MPALPTPMLHAAQWVLDPTARSQGPTGPWSPYETRRLAVTAVVAVAVWLTALVQVSGVDRVEDQAGWTAIAVVASLAAAGSGGAFLARGYRRTRFHRNATLRQLYRPAGDVGTSEQAPATVGRASAQGSKVNGGTLVANADMSYFHDVECPMVVERTVTVDSRANHLVAERRPCPWCQP